MEEPTLKVIWKIFLFIQVVFGDSRIFGKILKCVSVFLLFSEPFVSATVCYSFYIQTDLSMKIYFTNAITIVVVGGLFIPAYIALKDDYKALLEWCECVQQRFNCLLIFKECKKSATKVFKVMVVYLPVGVFVLHLGQWVNLSLESGEVVSAILTPTLSPISLMIFVSFYQIVGITVMIFAFGTVMGLIYVVLYYVIAVLRYLQEVAKKMERSQFEKDVVKEFVDLHCEIIEIQLKLARFAFTPSMVLELMAYTLLIYMWVVVFFFHDMVVIAVAASAAVAPFIFFCVIHEQFLDEHENLRRTLHNLEWYTMKPKQRILLLQVLVMVDHPRLLKTGPFHVVSYEEMGNVFQNVYSIGLCINKFLVI